MERVSDTEIKSMDSFYSYTIMDKDVSEKVKCPCCENCIPLIYPEIMIVIRCFYCGIEIRVLEEHEKEFMIERDLI